MSVDMAGVRRRFEDAGQGHVFRFWSDLSPEQQESLCGQLGTIDLAWVKRAGEDLRAGRAGRGA